jgi:hypothetical protein
MKWEGDYFKRIKETRQKYSLFHSFLSEGDRVEYHSNESRFIMMCTALQVSGLLTKPAGPTATRGNEYSLHSFVEFLSIIVNASFLPLFLLFTEVRKTCSTRALSLLCVCYIPQNFDPMSEPLRNFMRSLC